MSSGITALIVSVMCGVVSVGSAQADESAFEVSANVALVSDYVFRGISQSDESATVQGGFDLVHQSGLYAGVWGSGVDFNDGDEASAEVDLYAGYSAETAQGISYDIGGLYYAYPGADTPRDYDFWEIYGSIGYDFGMASARAGLNYSPDYFNESGDAVYTHLDVDVPLPQNFTLSGGLGYQTIDNNTAFGTPDYTDWKLSLGYGFKNLDLSVTYHDTDLDEPGECADGCDARIVFAISSAFSI
ncbi:MAG: TorF family putative porin [Alphaproteobacteria bacterium]